MDPLTPTAQVRRPGRSGPPAVGMDLLLVALFVLLGRTSHREGGALVGYLTAAWPFLAATLVGWGAVLLVRRAGRDLPGASIPAGIVVLAATVVVGMVLRRAFTDGGTPVSFLVVATSFLAALLLGWRGIYRAWRSGHARQR